MITYDEFGKESSTFVPFAAYRPYSSTTKYFSADNTTEIPNLLYTNYTATTTIFDSSINYTNSAVAFRNLLSTLPTDAEVQAKFAELENDNTSEQNTDYICSVVSGTSYWAPWIRTYEVAGYTLDLPNLYTLIQVYIASDAIDSIDPTADSYSERLLGYNNSSVNWRWRLGPGVMIFSSTGGSSTAYMSFVQWDSQVYSSANRHPTGTNAYAATGVKVISD